MTGKRPRLWPGPLVISGPGVPAHRVPAGVGGPPVAPPAFEPRRAQRAAPPDPHEHAVGERTLAGLAMGQAGAVQAGAVQAGVLPNGLAESPVRRALVVDDDPEVRRALARYLRPELDVRLAGSVSDARAVVASLDRLDVAFIDWELPDGTGEQILEWLSRWPDAIRVLISARFTSSVSPLSKSGVGDGARLRPSALPTDWSSAASVGLVSENPLKNRALANLLLGKPVATSVIEALKRAALALPQG